jgi:transcription initiation factor IIE alpha subunit
MAAKCPLCGSDRIAREGAQVTSDDEFEVMFEIGRCLDCGALLRYYDGHLEVISLKAALDAAVNVVVAAAERIAARIEI